jgi:class 3 adenylate cyclase
MAERIPGAKYVELSGVDHLPFVGNGDAIVDEIQEFLTGIRPAPEPDRVLATVMFIDIVGSTQQAATLGDWRWRSVLEQYRVLVRRELQRFRGREVDTAGDGFLATFEGPARAIRCALAIREPLHEIGLSVRAGLHTGEVELMGDGVGGIAVHIAARVAPLAEAGDVFVSSTVKDLVAGSGIGFEDRGSHVLKGVPGDWRIWAVLRGPQEVHN